MRQLCEIHEIPDGKAKGFVFDDTSVFAVRQGLECFVYANKCPHMGIELHWMEDQFLDQEQQFIQCSTHGALFAIEDGECIEGPCKGKTLTVIEHMQENGILFALV